MVDIYFQSALRRSLRLFYPFSCLEKLGLKKKCIHLDAVQTQKQRKWKIMLLNIKYQVVQKLLYDHTVIE